MQNSNHTISELASLVSQAQFFPPSTSASQSEPTHLMLPQSNQSALITTTQFNVDENVSPRKRAASNHQTKSVFEIYTNMAAANPKNHCYLLCSACKIGFICTEKENKKNFIGNHEKSERHKEALERKHLPNEDVPTKIRKIHSRSAIVDVQSKFYACLICRRLIQRNASKLSEHVGNGSHLSKLQIANELSEICDETNVKLFLTVAETALKEKGHDIISMENVDHSQKTANGHCKLCNKRFKIRLNLDHDINRHVGSKLHKRLWLLKGNNPNTSLSTIRFLDHHNKLQMVLGNYKCGEHVELKENDNQTIKFYCKICDKEIENQRYQLKRHIKSQKHIDRVPKSNGQTNNDFFYDNVEALICSK